MSVLAFMGLGFLGFLSNGFDGGEPNPITPWIGAPTTGHFIASEARLLAIEPQVSTKPMIVIPIHLAWHFKFETIVKDDGQGDAGGWQEAKANLPFGKVRTSGLTMWHCPITIGVPIRHSVQGFISPDTAATESARVTNSVTKKMDFDLPEGIFCARFRKEVEAVFPSMYPVGAKVGR